MKVKHHAQGADFNSRQGRKMKHVVTLEKNMFLNRLEISFTFSKSQTTTIRMHSLFFYKRASSKLETQKVVRHRACGKPWTSPHNSRFMPLYFFSSPRLERVTLRAKYRVRLAWLNCRLALNKCLGSRSWPLGIKTQFELLPAVSS